MKTSEVISILMKSIDKEIEIVIDNRFTKFCFKSYVSGFRVYQTVWSLITGEENLECRHEEKMKKMSLRLVFIEMIFKKKLWLDISHAI